MRVHCRECEGFLGEITPSAVGRRQGKLVWRIQPGWRWSFGVLEGDDETYRMERLLLHEMTGRERASDGIAMARECDLPVRVACRKCRTVRWITQDLAFRPITNVSMPGNSRWR